MSQERRKKVLSGIQPTGKLHIGNYIGALSQWAQNQDEFENFFCVVDLHALTIPENVNPQALRQKTREVAGLCLAAGIDPQKSTLFVQSEVSAHAELTWIFECLTPLGWLYRMTQFKTKSEQQESVGSGLLQYPVLQASDILLYEPDYVPVGEDQRQHIELARDIAMRFNHLFGEMFHLPEPMIRKTGGARIMGLDNPEQKMSKSVGETKKGHSIGILDPPKEIRQAIMRAVTDTGNEVSFERSSPGVKNLLALYQSLSGEAPDAIEAKFQGQGYGNLKKEVAEVVIAHLEPIRTRYEEIMGEPGYLDRVLEEGAAKARVTANRVLNRAKELAGLGH